jgi:ABC-2 type transport system ATP-binding protein
MGSMNGGNSGAVPDGSGRVLVQRLRKQFGAVEAVRDLSFTVEPGRVTGFLGPNGAGKTTTLRIAVGLVQPDAGEVTINGVRYEQLSHPARVVGAVLDSQGFHPGRTALAHLRCYTAAIGVPDRRAEEVLNLVGLSDTAARKVGGFSLGMRQRLALSTALLGDPQVLILDEPGSGLDPEGLAWLRSFLRAFADAGRTVLISSHQLAEVEQTVDHVVIISEGTGVFAGRMDQLGGAGRRLRVQCSDQVQLATALARRGVTDIQALPEGGLAVAGANSTTVGEVALAAGVAIYGISEQPADLERHFFELTNGQYQGRVQALGQPLDPSVFGPGSGAPVATPQPPSSAPPSSAPPSSAPPSSAPPAGVSPVPVTAWAPAPPPPPDESAGGTPAHQAQEPAGPVATPAQPTAGETSSQQSNPEKSGPAEPTTVENRSAEPTTKTGSAEPTTEKAAAEPTDKSGSAEPGPAEPGPAGSAADQQQREKEGPEGPTTSAPPATEETPSSAPATPQARLSAGSEKRPGDQSESSKPDAVNAANRSDPARAEQVWARPSVGTRGEKGDAE